MILIVEDDDLMRHVLQVFLEDCGYRVIVTSNEEQGLAMYGTRTSEIRLVMCSNTVPNADCVHLMRRLRALTPDIKIIVGGNFFSHDVRYRLMNEGASALLVKPYGSEEVLAAVRSVLGDNSTR